MILLHAISASLEGCLFLFWVTENFYIQIKRWKRAGVWVWRGCDLSESWLARWRTQMVMVCIGLQCSQIVNGHAGVLPQVKAGGSSWWPCGMACLRFLFSQLCINLSVSWELRIQPSPRLEVLPHPSPLHAAVLGKQYLFYNPCTVLGRSISALNTFY